MLFERKKVTVNSCSYTLENALQKARYIYDRYKCNCFADDTGLEIDSALQTSITNNPYLGLSSFTEREADRFFGRDKLVNRIYNAFSDLFERTANQKKTRVLTILGPSGSGKSSVIRAGFLAELAKRGIPGFHHIRTAVITPGSRPLGVNRRGRASSFPGSLPGRGPLPRYCAPSCRESLVHPHAGKEHQRHCAHHAVFFPPSRIED